MTEDIFTPLARNDSTVKLIFQNYDSLVEWNYSINSNLTDAVKAACDKMIDDMFAKFSLAQEKGQ